MNQRVVIADDDRLSRTLLDHYIQQLPEYTAVGEATSGEELIELVRKVKPAIALVDIQMPGMNGMEAAKRCKQLDPSLQVIFTTGNDQFAVEAFNLEAIDYIVKPIEKYRLYLALERAKHSLTIHQRMVQQRQESTKLEIKSNLTSLYVDSEDILYIEKEGRKSIIHMEEDRLETMSSLQELEGRLPSSFYRTHRSYLVNLRKINKIEAFGETYLAHFAHTQKRAHISKLQINTVYQLMGP